MSVLIDLRCAWRPPVRLCPAWGNNGMIRIIETLATARGIPPGTEPAGMVTGGRAIAPVRRPTRAVTRR